MSAREEHRRAVAEIAHWASDSRPDARAWYEDAVREAERLCPLADAERVAEEFKAMEDTAKRAQICEET